MLSLPYSSSSSSSSSSRKKYDVFLSFRGEDTRKNFTDHLYAAFKKSGIETFRDDSKLEPGEEIAPELLKAIQESWCSVIVFSETYTFSGWCLDELAEIVEQRKQRGHKIFPIFYKVDPSDLRKQKGKVEEAFVKHGNKDKTQRWRAALTEVANLKGWHLNNRHESEFIGDIVKKISAKLCETYPIVLDGLIGINSRLQELHLKIDIGEDGVRIIGICGMGGIGKTTLARVVYNQMSPHFEGTSFLANVREESEKSGLVSLQKQLLCQILSVESFNLFDVYQGEAIIKNRLCCRKVLLVIDDADNRKHLECLVGSRDWFGSGSRIIITTRDQHLLESYRVDDVYKPTTLDANEALDLFNLKAFGSDTVRENDFIELSKRVVDYADGLPLALEVLGSFLCGRDATQWRSAIERLKTDSHKDIVDKLQISFDGLEETEKNIFLDIACFFNWKDKDFVIKVLDGCEFFADIGIDVLIKKSLIKVEHYVLRMHDLLKEMGRKIVRQKSPNEPGKRCRLWEEKDVDHVLMNNTATELIEGISIKIKREHNITLLTDAFLKMNKLRLLIVFYDDDSEFYDDYHDYDDYPEFYDDYPEFYDGFYLQNSHDLKYLSNELRLLDWRGYPFKSLPSSFQPDNLVALRMPKSRIEQLWEGNMHLNKLKVVDLKGSKYLIKTPDFSLAPNLESLILNNCTRIVEVHPSIGVLSKLKLLDLSNCKHLRSLPIKIGIGMKSLEELDLSGCSSLQRFPEIDGETKCLLKLHLGRTGIEELPSSIRYLSGLKFLTLSDCKNLRSVPTKIIGMEALEELVLSGCSNLERFPEIDGERKCLLKLYLDGTGIEELPFSIRYLCGPKVLILKDKRHLKAFRHLSELPLLNLKDCSNLVSLPSSINGLKCLKTLNLSGCKGPIALMLPFLSYLTSLTYLDLSDCNLVEGDIPSDICCLSSLTELDLSGNNFISLPATLGRLPMLRELDLLDCRMLQSLPDFLTGIEQVNIDGCASQEVVVDPTTVHKKRFDVTIIGINCYKLAERNNALTFLKKHLKIHADARACFSLLVPGSEIPEWFSHQMDETSVKMPLPPIIGNNSPWVGVAFCCVFDFAPRPGLLWFHAHLSFIDIRIPDVYRFNPIIYLKRKDGRPRFKGDHLWLFYWTRNELYNSKLNGEHVCDEILECRTTDECGIKVKKCGVRLVYEKDLEEMEEIEEHSSSPASAKFDDHGLTGNDGALLKRKRNIYELHGALLNRKRNIYEEIEEHSSSPASAKFDDHGLTGNDGALLKRKRNIYELHGALLKRKRNIYEAGASESDSAGERPQPKLLKRFLNFFMGKQN